VSLNGYDYALQDPINSYDLEGTCVPVCAVIGAAVVIGGYEIYRHFSAQNAGSSSSEPSPQTVASFERQLEQHGPGSLMRSDRTILKRLTEHVRKLYDIQQKGGQTSSVEREIRTFISQRKAIQRVLKNHHKMNSLH
jgi:hypothetical protein